LRAELRALSEALRGQVARGVRRGRAPIGAALGGIVIEEAEAQSISTEMDLRMLAYFLGRERSFDRLIDLAREAGLVPGTVTRARPRSIIELLPDRSPQAG